MTNPKRRIKTDQSFFQREMRRNWILDYAKAKGVELIRYGMGHTCLPCPECHSESYFSIKNPKEYYDPHRIMHWMVEPGQEPCLCFCSCNEPVKTIEPDPLPLPCRIFETQNKMDDYNAPDMKHGDLTERELKERFGLIDVSDRVDAYKRSLLEEDNKVRVHELFEEFRDLSDFFSWYGKYDRLMRKMITHMQGNSGQPFMDPLLDQAMKERILEDKSKNSSLINIGTALKENINKDYGIYPLSEKNAFASEIQKGRLPKFNDIQDRINGLGIIVHDIWATHITLESLHINGNQFRAMVHYRIQDHFGLDEKDITNNIFKSFRLFRIWFVLQRWEHYGYKPFITEMNVRLPIEGTLR